MFLSSDDPYIPLFTIGLDECDDTVNKLSTVGWVSENERNGSMEILYLSLIFTYRDQYNEIKSNVTKYSHNK